MSEKPTHDEDGFETPDDFYFRKTGITGSVTLTLKLANGEEYNGSASADLEEGKIGQGLAILTAGALAILTAGAGNFLAAASGGTVDTQALEELMVGLGLKPPERGSGDA